MNELDFVKGMCFGVKENSEATGQAINQAIRTYQDSPADNSYQRGYLYALHWLKNYNQQVLQ